MRGSPTPTFQITTWLSDPIKIQKITKLFYNTTNTKIRTRKNYQQITKYFEQLDAIKRDQLSFDGKLNPLQTQSMSYKRNTNTLFIKIYNNINKNLKLK